MRKTKRSLGGILAACALTLGIGLIHAPAAQAYPGGCSAYISTDSRAYGSCSSGTGQYRIGIPCKNIFTAWYQYSGWRSVGTPADVGCPVGSGVWWDIAGGPQVLIEKRN